MAAKPVLNAKELAEALREAGPATPDDVTVLPDGRRIDSRESALAWLNDLDAARAAAIRRNSARNPSGLPGSRPDQQGALVDGD